MGLFLKGLGCSRLFKVSFFCKVDFKGRLCWPSALRSKLVENQEVVITTNLYREFPCLDIYLSKQWERFKQQVSSPLEIYHRFYISPARKVLIDRQYRLLIPLPLRKHATFQSLESVVLLGLGLKLEIWSEKNWKKAYQSAFKDFNSVLSQLNSEKEKGE